MPTSLPSSLVFTPELLEKCSKGFNHSASLLERLASIKGAGGEEVRAQIERAAVLVPESQRPRVLGPLLTGTNDQAQATIGTLFLAKSLCDLGWVVEHEPEAADGTPDLRIRKGDHEYIVEVRRVIDTRYQRDEVGLAKLRDALGEIKTSTPLAFHSIRISGKASLKPFVRHVKAVLAAPRPTGIQFFDENDVSIEYEIVGPFAEGLEASAASFFPVEIIQGLPTDAIQKAIHEKMNKYKIPIIVALDLFESHVNEEAVVNAMFGNPSFTFDFDPKQGLVGLPRTSRSPTGLLMKRGNSGDTVRKMLQAVIAFRLFSRCSESGLDVHARLLSNPARETLHGFEEFAPLPRLLVTSETAEGRLLQYRGEDNSILTEEIVAKWSHHP